MLGAIGGDIIGSVYERSPIKSKDFPLFHPHCTFTDDTVLTVAVADAILHHRSYLQAVYSMGNRYPHAGYGGTFRQWLCAKTPLPYNSWGNGSAMRVSPVGHAFSTAEEVLAEAEKSAAISHNHQEGIKGAQAVALTVFLAREGVKKAAIRKRISDTFGYDLARTVDDIRPSYAFDVSCQGSVPEAIIAFLDAESYEDAVRNAVSLGGDSDTLACMAGAMAEAFYDTLPEEIQARITSILPPELLTIVHQFYRRYLPCFRLYTPQPPLP